MHLANGIFGCLVTSILPFFTEAHFLFFNENQGLLNMLYK
jgi:hypothetical protein